MMRSASIRGLAAMLLPLIFLSGCAAAKTDGHDDDSKDSARKAQLGFAKCMRGHGVDVPDPEPGDGGMIKLGPGDDSGSGPDRTTIEKAQKACAKYLKKMGGPARAELSEADKARMLKFAACMRKHGVDMPDPNFSEGGGVHFEVPRGGGSGDLAGGPGDPAFKDAHQACKRYYVGPAT